MALRKKFKRKHFGWGTAGAFVMMLVTAPPSPRDKSTPSAASGSAQAVLSPAQARALEKKNTTEIAKLKKEAATAETLDDNLHLQSPSRAGAGQR